MENKDPFKGWGAKSQEQTAGFFEALNSGEIRMEIPCNEARREWFVMARNMYVANNPEPRMPIDAEIGIHFGGCQTPECRTLAKAYSEILRPSHPYADQLLADTIDELERRIFAEDPGE